MAFDVTGSVRKTANGAVGRSGKSTRVWSASLLCGHGNSFLQLRNGTSEADDLYTNASAALGVFSQHINFENGLLFPSGCYYDHDANASSAIIEFAQEN